MNHKAHAIELAQEKKRTSQLEHENRKMARKLQALELLYATGNLQPLETSVSYSNGGSCRLLEFPDPTSQV